MAHQDFPLPDAATTDRLVAWLASPSTYPGNPRVEVAETHISWVFLTPDLVYKLKKPVRFEFLDFSTADKRKVACEDELRLNHRMAPSVYLAVLPVTESGSGGLSFDGQGRTVDWLVQMRRLPADRMLDELLRRGALTVPELDGLAGTLAAFYRQATPAAISPDEYRSAYEGRVLATARELADPQHGLNALQVERVNSAQQRYLLLAAEQVGERPAQGRVIEGHGDLRPEHVCLIEPPVVFDCIEFNAAFRRIDVADELSFLAMECDRLGRPEVGDTILARYADAANDVVSPELVSFYKAYRASVRSKVAALRAAEHQGDQREEDRREAAAYLELAERYVAQLPKPPLVLVRGVSGSGKSTLARQLAERLGARLLQTDEVRRTLAAPLEAAQRYRPENRAAVYDELFARAAELLRQGLMVVLDGTFLESAHRQRAAEIARSNGHGCLQLQCVVSVQIAQARIAERLARSADASEATPELVERQLAADEPDGPECPLTAVIDTSRDVEAGTRAAILAISLAR